VYENKRGRRIHGERAKPRRLTQNSQGRGKKICGVSRKAAKTGKKSFNYHGASRRGKKQKRRRVRKLIIEVRKLGGKRGGRNTARGRNRRKGELSSRLEFISVRGSVLSSRGRGKGGGNLWYRRGRK